MTDFISTPTPEEVKTKSSQAMFYIRKIHANPEFYANEKKRIKEYKLQRHVSHTNRQSVFSNFAS